MTTEEVGDTASPQDLLGVTPSPEAVDISPLKNGKLWRESLGWSGGDADLGVCNGMEVQVHYKGSLVDGTVFDENREGDIPFKFTVGESSVIEGWDKGLVGVKKGEKIKLWIHSDMGYKDNATGNIPPNSTLIFEIIVVDYKPEDLTKGKNGQILRYIVKEGRDKWINPNHGSELKILIRGSCKDKVVFPEQTLTFQLGEGCELGIPYGVEKALYKFRNGEGSHLIIKGKKYGLSEAEREKHGLTVDDSLLFYVELLSSENMKEPWQLDGPEKLEISRKLKEVGNKFFGQQNHRVAFKNYKLIVDHLKAEALLQGDEEEERKKLLLAAYLNMAICNLKLDRPTVAIRNCDDALDMEPNNTKALFRRGLAYVAVNLPEQAKLDFEKLLTLEPSNTAAAQQHALCEKKIKENLKKEKQMYSKMFSNSVCA